MMWVLQYQNLCGKETQDNKITYTPHPGRLMRPVDGPKPVKMQTGQQYTEHRKGK